MERKPVSDAKLADLGEFQGIIDRNSNFGQQAVNHNLGRNIRVIKLLGYLGLLRRSGTSLPVASSVSQQSGKTSPPASP